MRRAFEKPGLLVFLCGFAFGQSAPAPPAFEAADVHVSAAGATGGGGFLPNGRLEFHASTLLHLIRLAYNVPADRVAGGPSWLDTDRFDAIAKAASPATPPSIRTMFQNLLAERFNLSIQREQQALPVHALVLGRRGSPKESSSAGASECKAGSEGRIRTYTCHNMSIEGLAARLPGVVPGYFDYPLVDRTGLKGAYDFTLQWLPRGQLAPGSEGQSLSLFYSIEQQLGVKVETQTAPMEVIKVLHANRTPSANLAGVSEKLGAQPTEFDAAQIHISRPDEKQDMVARMGRLEARAMSLKELIAYAYEVEEDSLTGGEKWLESDRFDIVAKTTAIVSSHTLRVMLQSALADRFGLKVHKEQQPVTVYAITQGKRSPKLKDADPSARTECKPSAIDGARTYTCHNITMAQLAENLRDVATAYLDHPVVDLTGLKSAYDFTLTWAPRAKLLGDGRAASGDSPVPLATDRPVGLTIFEAIDRQLGLKLSAQKHPMPVIVIDHVDRTPTEN